MIKKLASELSRLKTSSSIVSFMHDKKISRSRKIRVHPKSISRQQQKGLPTNGRIQSGRPAKTKRSHNISLSFERNQPTAKKHCIKGYLRVLLYYYIYLKLYVNANTPWQ